MKLSKAKFIKESRYPDLTKAVLNQCGVDWKDLCAYPNDYRDASAGVSGFIYYTETVAFAKRHLVKIINALNEFGNDRGLLNKPTDDETQYFNWLSWFALESVVSDIIHRLEE